MGFGFWIWWAVGMLCREGVSCQRAMDKNGWRWIFPAAQELMQQLITLSLHSLAHALH